jgi:exonuclease III
MHNVRLTVSDNWLVIGDFNMILRASDKSNSILNRRFMWEFRNFVQDKELREICLKGRKITWSNDNTQTRIDKAFCTATWKHATQLSTQWLNAMSSLVSDHCPLLLIGQDIIPRYRGFRFECF